MVKSTWIGSEYVGHVRPGWWFRTGILLAIILGLAAARQSQAAETLFLDGAAPQLRFNDDNGVLQVFDVLGDNSGLDIANVTLGTTPFHIDSDAAGFIGLGTAIPLANLHILSNTAFPALRLEATTIPGARAWEWRVNAGRIELVDVTNLDETPLAVGTGAPTDTLYLTGTGQIGMGTAIVDANSQLDIRSSLTNGLLAKRADSNPHYLRVENTVGTFRCGVQANGDTQFGPVTAGKGLNLIAGGTSKLAINASGQISFGTVPPAITTHALVHSSGARLTSAGVWTNASSRAFKQDIEPITSEEARDTVRALQPVGYRYKNELDERYVGFIAEDVPELVATGDRKALSPMDITAVLTRVVQDQDRTIAKLEQAEAAHQQLIDSLSKRLADLEQKSERAE